jgi:phage-related protein
MTWTVETLNDTVDAKVRLVLAPFGDANFLTEISALPNDMKAKFVWISNLIAEHGLEKVGKPYVKYLEQGIWEIRLKGRDGISRALYVTAKPKRVVVVRVFIKKTQKTPRKEIKLALKRAKEIQS